MKRVLFIGFLLTVMLAPMMMVRAQDPGEGLTIVEGIGGASIGSLNPLICNDTGCRAPLQFMFPTLVGVEPQSATLQPDQPGALASDWTISDDGLVYTFNFRTGDFTWNDDTPITVNDVLFSYLALTSGEFDSPLTPLYQEFLADVTVDEAASTVTVTYNNATCQNVSYAGFPILPAHVWGWTPDQADFDFSVMGSDDFGNNPTVSAGVFQFRERRTDAIVLEANTEWQGVEGVAPAGYIAVLVPDQVAQLERFLAGDLNIHTGPPVADRQRVREDSNVQVYEYPGNAWDYLGLNFASPDSPRTAEVAEDGTVTWVDADGNSYEAEEPHWLFGDVRVRRAIQLSLNMEEIMEKAVFGEGQQMASAQIPTSWATDPNLAPIPYDPEAALALFAEAGWTQNADGEMVNADGELFEFELITNVENPRRMQITEMIQAQLGEMGISVILNPLDFQQVLEIMDAQDFDAFVLGWREGFPDDPDQTQLFSASQDIVGGGSNNSSYYNPKVEELFAQALQVPGCRPEDRAPIYYEIQKIMQDDQAYVFLFAIDGMYAAQTSLNWGAGPLPAQPYWNVETWDVASN